MGTSGKWRNLIDLVFGNDEPYLAGLVNGPTLKLEGPSLATFVVDDPVAVGGHGVTAGDVQRLSYAPDSVESSAQLLQWFHHLV